MTKRPKPLSPQFKPSTAGRPKKPRTKDPSESRLPQTGSAVTALHERTPEKVGLTQALGEPEPSTTVEQVVAALGLGLGADNVNEIRGRLRHIAAYEFPLGAHKERFNRLRIGDVQKALLSIANGLEATEKILRSREGGVIKSHDLEVATAVVNRVMDMLSVNPEVLNAPGWWWRRNAAMAVADGFLSDFCKRAATISHACRIAAKDLSEVAEKMPRRQVEDWFLDFVKLLLFIRKNASAKGPGLTQLARGFAKLLPPVLSKSVRDMSDETLKQRLRRMKKLLGDKSVSGSG